MTLLFWLFNYFRSGADDDDDNRFREQYREELRILKRRLVEYETELL